MQVPIPDDMKETVSARRAELVERVAEVDEAVGELFLLEQPVDADSLRDGIRRATLALNFVPVFMGRYMDARVAAHHFLHALLCLSPRWPALVLLLIICLPAFIDVD